MWFRERVPGRSALLERHVRLRFHDVPERLLRYEQPLPEPHCRPLWHRRRRLHDLQGRRQHVRQWHLSEPERCQMHLAERVLVGLLCRRSVLQHPVRFGVRRVHWLAHQRQRRHLRGDPGRARYSELHPVPLWYRARLSSLLLIRLAVRDRRLLPSHRRHLSDRADAWDRLHDGRPVFQRPLRGRCVL